MDKLEKKGIEAKVEEKVDLSGYSLPNLHASSFLTELKKENSVLYEELVHFYADKIVPKKLTGREAVVKEIAGGLTATPAMISETGNNRAFMDYLNSLREGNPYNQFLFWQTANYLIDKGHLTEDLKLPGLNFGDELLKVALVYDLEHNKGSSVLGDEKLFPPDFKNINGLSGKIEYVKLTLELIRDDPDLQERYHRFYSMIKGLDKTFGELENKAMQMIAAVETAKVELVK